jgi:pantothenate kinase
MKSAWQAASMTERLAPLIARAIGLAERDHRSLLGITGAPGAGKSTLAAALAAAVPRSLVVPMDGLHLTTAELAARGWVAERGTPRTFDADAYLALLRELRGGGRVLAPAFDRSREEPVPDAIAVAPEVRLVITEGNYLLLDTPPWAQVRAELDEVWFVDAPDAVRLERLVARHVEFGRTQADAMQRATSGSDADNARIVVATRSRADLIVDVMR